jgi:TonB-linked SusC/RagA family outer membrane protein
MNKIIDEAFFVSTEATDQSQAGTIGRRQRSKALGRRIEKIMRLTTAILIIGALHVSALGIAQKISISGKNVSLSVVFNAIETQTGFGVVMSNDLWKVAKPVSVDFKEATLDQVLKKCFEFQPWKLKYIIFGHSIAISKDDQMLSTGNEPSPKNTVRVDGTVYNEANEPLSGANVVIKELNKGTTTNAKGEFEIPAISVNGTLIVSFIGYAPEQLKIKDGGYLKIILKAAKNELDKVVIQAYGETTQRLTTSDISSVRAEEIAKQPVMNVLEVLQGQVPGAVVTNTSGYSSGQIKVEIWGRNTINPNFPSDPLYIVDGVPLTVLDVTGSTNYATGAAGFIQSGLSSDAGASGSQSPLFSINPSDIESVQVLKDADATAIYGSRGSNGVILITTKKGKPGKTHFEINLNQGESTVTRMYPLGTTAQYIAMRKEALYNDALPINSQTAPDLLYGDSTRYTNWQKFLVGRLGTNTNVDCRLSGGSDLTNFLISGGYHYLRDMTAASGGNGRASVLLNLNHKSVNQRLSIGLTANFSSANVNQISMPGTPNMSPNTPAIFDNNGNLNFSGWDEYFSGLGQNPFSVLLEPYSANTIYFNGSFQLKYDVVKGLSFKTNVGYNYEQTFQKEIAPVASGDPAQNATGTITLGNTLVHNILVEPQLEFLHYIGAGKVDALVGGTAQKNITSGTYNQGTGITNDAVIEDFSSAPIKSANYYFGEYRYAGIFGRVNYNLINKYIVNLNVRRDGSSRFGPGKQYGNFGSVGAVWIFTEEAWAKRMFSFINFGKLRMSYGLTGGDQIGDYQYLTQWLFGNYPYNGQLPLTPIKHTDSLFHWQTTKKTDLGIDLSFFKDWVVLSISRYISRTSDQLVTFPTPNFTGFSSVVTNSPADVQNSGWEFTLNNKIIDGKSFRLSSRLMVGINRNKLVSYPNLLESPYAGQFLIGKPLNIERVLHETGVNPQTGFYTFKDKNKDGQITFDPTGRTPDDSYVYDLNPKFDGSFKIIIGYKRFDLDALFYFRDQLGATAASSLAVPGAESNQPVDILKNHWQRPGQIAEYAKFTTNPSDISWYYYQISDATLTDASFIRMQNLSLSYSLFANGSKHKGVESGRILIRGQNLLLITKYKGSDPEIQSFSTLPLPRIVTFGFDLNFQ